MSTQEQWRPDQGEVGVEGKVEEGEGKVFPSQSLGRDHFVLPTIYLHRQNYHLSKRVTLPIHMASLGTMMTERKSGPSVSMVTTP